MKLIFPAMTIALLAGLLAWLFLRPPTRPVLPPPPPLLRSQCPPLDPGVSSSPPPSAQSVRWLLVGAASSPADNQISIEQDGALLRRVLGPAGMTLLAGGPGARDVQVTARQVGGDRLLQELADLIAPRGGRDSRYRRGQLPRHGAATAEELGATLLRLLDASTAPLMIYLGGHGEQGELPRDNYVALWGGERLTARDLATWLDRGTRPVQLIVTSCYGGGFAEVVFRGGDPKRGVAPGRCGLFATTEDLPATGCDPNPDRQAQQGYALHFFHALERRGRDGKPLVAAAIDLDGDGAVSLAEAHARTRIDLATVDVPTSTSERFLREVAPRVGPRRALPLPEEHAVVRALAAQIGVAAEPTAARREIAVREAGAERARAQLERLYAAEDRAARRVTGELLARWPVLDDPWHSDFAELVRCQRSAIAAHLKASASYSEYLDTRQDVTEAEDRFWTLRRQIAPLERLTRSLETIELAERLQARGGAPWQSFAAILACERTVPAR
jgi:hypothetical protein